jgi:hypothetical protein
MRCDYREEWVLASNALAQGVTIEGVGKQCAGTRCDNREERVLASNALAQGVTIEGVGKQCAGTRCNGAHDLSGYKCDFMRMRT